MKKNSEDEESTNKPHLNCLIDKEYFIQLVIDEPDSNICVSATQIKYSASTIGGRSIKTKNQII